MENIRWHESFSVGVAAFDHDNKTLAEMINRLTDNAQMGVGTEIVTDVLCGLVTYAREHFDREEKCLLQNGYPNIADHADSHIQFCEVAAIACFDAAAGNLDVNQLLAFLRRWWIEHVLHEDMSYRAYLNGRGVF